MIILSIDVGVANFAYILALLVKRVDAPMLWTIGEILECKRLDIREFECDRSTCTLHHEKCVTDYLKHVYTLHTAFPRAEKVLVEYQPPAGCEAVQESIRDKYRDIVQMIHPNSVHAFFGLSRRIKGPLAYERRKEWSVSFATRMLKQWGWSLETDIPGPRKHDVADAFMNLWFHISQMNTKILKGKSKYFMPRLPTPPHHK